MENRVAIGDRLRHVTLKGQGRDPNVFRAIILIYWKQLQILFGNNRNGQIVCCEAVQSAILASNSFAYC